MSPEQWMIVRLSACFLLLFTAAELLYHIAGMKAEHTRRLVHVGTGLLTLLFPVCFIHLWQAIIICGTFLLLLLLSSRLKLLPSINAVARKSWGSVLYPVAVAGVFAFYLYMQRLPVHFHAYVFFFLPVLIMAVCDPIAAVAGQRFRPKQAKAGSKTIAGMLAFFVTAFLLSLLLLATMQVRPVPWFSVAVFSLVMAMLTATTEFRSRRGTDNLTVPAMAALVLFLLEKTLP